ncbi:hypothetical protein FD06_GL000691 [Apilactobacillus ozensis DSM 23829 = JCM 17196]|uniref:GW domain-containing protein n=2 Tax=Apilactobacillus ozensis TaxID=866801 RepID=A0A0R2AP80_9LACO|nr:hypothetical protein [Apilactobacillus ozensis]KRM67540.1 hypothetical protein FD06_GL000691 [Apilactobacillus ozensis DSM 23829 = JCM 17196]
MQLRKNFLIITLAFMLTLFFSTSANAQTTPKVDSQYWNAKWRHVKLTSPWKIKLSQRYQDPKTKGWDRRTIKTRILPTGSKVYITKYLDHMTVSITKPNTTKAPAGLGKQSWRYLFKRNQMTFKLLNDEKFNGSVKLATQYKSANFRDFPRNTWSLANIENSYDYSIQCFKVLFKNQSDLVQYEKYDGQYSEFLEASDGDVSDSSASDLEFFNNVKKQRQLYLSKAIKLTDSQKQYLVKPDNKNSVYQIYYNNKIYFTDFSNLRPYNTVVNWSDIDSNQSPNDYKKIVLAYGDEIYLFKGLKWNQTSQGKQITWTYDGYKWVK